MPLLCINTPAPYSRIFPGHNPTASASGSTGRVFPPSLAESLWDALPPPAALTALAPDTTPCNNTPASPPTRSPAAAPSGCSPGRMPAGAAALPLLCNLIYSLQSLLSQFKDYYPGVWITKQIVINRVRLLVKNRIYPVVFIIYITFRQIPPCHFIPSLFPPLNLNYSNRFSFRSWGNICIPVLLQIHNFHNCSW